MADDDEIVPRRMRVLGEALQPVLEGLRRRIASPEPAQLPQGADAHTQVELLTEQFQQATTRLEQRIGAFMDEVIHAPAARDADVYRSVARFEAALETLLHGHETACAMAADPVWWEAHYPAGLLKAVYRRLLDEIAEWLEPLVRALADPLAELQRRGLPACGRVELDMRLVASTAPESYELANWISSRRRKASGGPSLLNTLGVALVGWKIGDALFGDKERDG